MHPAQRKKHRLILEALKNGKAAAGLPKELSAAAEALRRSARAWLAETTIQGVGIGEKLVGGEAIGVPSIRIYVSRKLKGKKVAAPAPRFLKLGKREVAVDVIEIGEIELHSLKEYRRPIHPGLCIANENRNAGTLGLMLRSNQVPEEFYVLSNYHVLGKAPGSSVTSIIQPARNYPGAANRKIADYHAYFPMQASKTGYRNLADAAIAKLLPDVPASAALPELGTIKGLSDSVKAGELVHIVGSSSGASSGTVIDPDFEWAVAYPTAGGKSLRYGFYNQVLCTRYAQGGDSGAAVLNGKNQALGLHVAGTNGTSIFCRLGPILRHFDCVLASDAELGARVQR